MNELKFSPQSITEPAQVFGTLDANLKAIEKDCNVEIIYRGDEITVKGEEVDRAASIINELFAVVDQGQSLDEQKINYIISLSQDGISYTKSNVSADVVCFTHRGKPIKAKTLGQKDYVDAIRKHDVCFGIGPAGTGKTYLAVAMAVKAFKAKEVNRIILTRPAVEAGESLGFLPGDLQQKVDPYLRPLYDALFEMFGAEGFQRQMERGVIEVAPLAYMRGRTLDESFIILDEAQNTTSEQMKMFLTRLGNGSKAVITGDVTQIDLPGGKKSGLVEVTKILKNIEGITTVKFDERDVVRHHLVQEIVKAYERYAEKSEGRHHGK